MRLAVGIACVVASSAAHAQCLLDKVSATQAGMTNVSPAVDGTTLFVGAPYEDIAGEEKVGAVYVYERSTPYASDWVLAQKLVSPQPTDVGRFGVSLALEGDRALIGEYAYLEGGNVYVFERSGAAWTFTGKIEPLDPSLIVGFGQALALQGDVAVIGDPFQDEAGGAVYIFERLAGAWAEVAKFTVPAHGVWLGDSVALDGDTVLAGAPAASFDKGKAYVYEKQGGIWSETALLSASDAAPHLQFGRHVALEGDVAVVSRDEDSEPEVWTGAVYVFERSAGVWAETQKLQPAKPVWHSQFGISVALSADTLLVGSARGSAYVFKPTAGGWKETATLATNPFPPATDFGAQVALAPGGQGIGAIADPGDGFGSVYPVQLGSFGFLEGTPEAYSVAAGGEHALELRTCPAVSNGLYFLLGSAAGIEPGLPVLGTLLPLNLDFYLWYTASYPGYPPLVDNLGALDPAGMATAKFVLAPGEIPELVGLHLDHAALVMDLSQGNAVFASEPAGLDFVP